MLSILNQQLKEIKGIDILKFDKSNRNGIYEYCYTGNLPANNQLLENDLHHDILLDLQFVSLSWVKDNINYFRMNKVIAYNLLAAKKVAVEGSTKTFILLENGEMKEVAKVSCLPDVAENLQTKHVQPEKNTSFGHLSFFHQATSQMKSKNPPSDISTALHF